jgi:5-hydroxyisourate hydrolase
MRILTRVLDGAHGRPAAGVHAHLSRANGDGWVAVADAETDDDGQIKDWAGRTLDRGLYRIVFDSDSYFACLGATVAYPEVIVTFWTRSEFRTQSEAHVFHVQVTLSPYSYSTYFGHIDDWVSLGAAAR